MTEDTKYNIRLNILVAATSVSLYTLGWLAGTDAGVKLVVEERRKAFDAGVASMKLDEAEVRRICKAWWFGSSLKVK